MQRLPVLGEAVRAGKGDSSALGDKAGSPCLCCARADVLLEQMFPQTSLDC